jgi:hypothetical protein
VIQNAFDCELDCTIWTAIRTETWDKCFQQGVAKTSTATVSSRLQRSLARQVICQYLCLLRQFTWRLHSIAVILAWLVKEAQCAAMFAPLLHVHAARTARKNVTDGNTDQSMRRACRTN